MSWVRDFRPIPRKETEGWARGLRFPFSEHVSGSSSRRVQVVDGERLGIDGTKAGVLLLPGDLEVMPLALAARHGFEARTAWGAHALEARPFRLPSVPVICPDADRTGVAAVAATNVVVRPPQAHGPLPRGTATEEIFAGHSSGHVVS